MSSYSIAHLGLTVSSIDRTSDFYAKYFGFTRPAQKFPYKTPWIGTMVGHEGTDFTLGFLSLGDLVIELHEYNFPIGNVAVPPDTTYVGCAHIAVKVNDVQGLYEEMAADGVDFISAPSRVSEGLFEGFTGAYCRDPDGYIVEINEAPAQEPDKAELTR